MTKTFQATFDGSALIPLDAVDLPRDAVIDLAVVASREGGTEGAADATEDPVIAALRRSPPIPREWMDEVERNILESKQPGNLQGIFDGPPVSSTDRRP